MQQQGTSDWHESRRGLITASRLGDVLAKPTTKRYRLLLAELRAERAGISIPEEELDKPWFRTGKEYEAEARGVFEFTYGIEVTQTGLLVSGNCGCSPDGLIGDDGGIEIKVRTAPGEHIKTIEKGLPSVYKPQVQGCMMVTGREWWWFVSYYVAIATGKRDLYRVLVKRDEKYIARLRAAVDKFEEELCSV